MNFILPTVAQHKIDRRNRVQRQGDSEKGDKPLIPLPKTLTIQTHCHQHFGHGFLRQKCRHIQSGALLYLTKIQHKIKQDAAGSIQKKNSPERLHRPGPVSV
jgi:hypothetical protein